jgi:hypothetical protein
MRHSKALNMREVQEEGLEKEAEAMHAKADNNLYVKWVPCRAWIKGRSVGCTY